MQRSGYPRIRVTTQDLMESVIGIKEGIYYFSTTFENIVYVDKSGRQDKEKN